MAQFQERALVLDVANYRESSAIIRLITEHQGRISLVARGLRNTKNKSGASASAVIQPFNLLQVRFSLKDGTTLGNLISAELEQPAIAPHDSINAYALISLWFEILRETSTETTAVSDTISLTAALLVSQKNSPGLTLDYVTLLLELCRNLGYAVTWHACVMCGRERAENHVPRHFSIVEGGIVCSACAATANRSGVFLLHQDEARAVMATLRSAAKTADAAPSEKDLMAILALIHRYLVYHIEHPLTTYQFVKSVIDG